METESSLQTEPTTANLLKVAVTMSAVSLILSGWTFISSLDESAFESNTEQRLVCLEQPGPNDCGLDAR